MSGSRRTGPLLMVAASAAFTAMIALVKVAQGWDFHTSELMIWRVFAAIPVLYLLTGVEWRIQRWDLLLLRCALGFCAMYCFFTATTGLGIGELSVLTKLQPVFVAFIAPLTLGRTERAGRQEIAALALGMTGTIALVWPALGESSVRLTAVGYAIGAALFSACAHTALRALGNTERPAAVVFWFQLAVGVGAVTATFFGSRGVTVPALPQIPLLTAIGVCAVMGQLWMTRAYRADRAARVAAASYISPLMGFGVDAAFFGTVPTPWTAVGAVLVVSAGGVLLLKEQAEIP